MTPVDLYLSNLDAPSTQAAYRRVLAALHAYTGTAPEQCGAEQLAAYRSHLAESGRAPATIRLHLSALSAFYTFARQQGWRSDNPTAGMKRPRVDRGRTVRGPTPDQMVRLIEAAADPREEAMSWCLAHGVRRAELVNLNVEDVEPDRLRVSGKRRKSRVVAMEAAACAAVQRYIGGRKQGPLFTGPNGRLSVRTVARMVAEMGRRVGIPDLHPHAWRHGFASSLANSGSNAFTIAAALGHDDIRVSQVYVNLHERIVSDELRRIPLATRAAGQRLHVIEGGQLAADVAPLPSKDNAGVGRAEESTEQRVLR